MTQITTNNTNANHLSQKQSKADQFQQGNQVPFSEVFDSAETNPKKKFVKIGDLTYKVENNVRPQQKTTEQKDPNSQKESSEEPPKNLSLASYIVSPLNNSTFVANLPVSLQNFIQEVVQVIQTHSMTQKNVNVEFKFKSLGLDVSLVKNENGILKIKLVAKNAELHKDLSNKNIQSELIQALKDKLPDQNIELELLDSHNKEGHSDKDANQDSNSDKEDSQKEQVAE